MPVNGELENRFQELFCMEARMLEEIGTPIMGGLMYSPRIREDLVSRLYREAKRRKLRMTQLVNLIVEHALHTMEQEILPEVHEKGCGCGTHPVPHLKATAS